MAFFFKKEKPTKSKELLRDESKHIKCQFKDSPDDCKDICDNCAISIKTAGNVAFDHQDYDAAIKYFLIALEKEPNFAEAWVGLGNAYGLKSEYSNALYAFNKAIEQDITYGKALLGKAITLRNTGKYNDAIVCLDDVLKLYDHENSKKIKADIENYLTKITTNDSIKLESDSYMELKEELVNFAKQKGYLAEGLPFIPELIFLIQPFIATCFSEVSKISKNYFDAMSRSIAWSFFGGMGAAVLWRIDWSELKNEGIYELLTREEGIEELDECVFDLVNIAPWSNEHLALIEFVKDCSFKTLNYIMNNLKDCQTDEQKASIAKQAFRAMFDIGVGIEMNRLGMK